MALEHGASELHKDYRSAPESDSGHGIPEGDVFYTASPSPAPERLGYVLRTPFSPRSRPREESSPGIRRPPCRHPRQRLLSRRITGGKPSRGVLLVKFRRDKQAAAD